MKSPQPTILGFVDSDDAQKLYDDLVGAKEIADRLHVLRGTVTAWIRTRRTTGIPEPKVILSAGQFFSWAEIRSWWFHWVPGMKSPKLGHLDVQEMKELLERENINA